MQITHVKKISFVSSFSNDVAVTQRKRKSVLGYFAATEAYNILVIPSYIHILIIGRFDGSVIQSTTDEDCLFLLYGFSAFSILKLV